MFQLKIFSKEENTKECKIQYVLIYSSLLLAVSYSALICAIYYYNYYYYANSIVNSLFLNNLYSKREVTCCMNIYTASPLHRTSLNVCHKMPGAPQLISTDENNIAYV